MKVSLKQLKGDTFDIDVDPESSVGDLKAKVAELKPDMAVEHQKLIYAGKVLVDATLMKDCGIKEGQFIVVMVSKVKPPAGSAAAAPAPAEAAPAPAPAEAPAPAADAAPAAAGGGNREVFEQLRNHPQFAQMAAMVQQNPQALAQLLPAIAQTNPGLVQAIMQDQEGFMQMLQEAGGGGGRTVIHLSEEEQAAVKRLSDLGFDRGAAAEAYLACDKNEEVAANFLFENGAGDGDAGMVSMGGAGGGGSVPFPMMGAGGGGGGDEGAAGGGDGEGGDSVAVLAQLRNHPQFAQLAQMVLQNPQILPEIVNVVAQTNPEVERAIRENPQELVRLLHEAVGGGGGAPGGGAPGGGAPQPGGTLGGGPPGGMQLSEDERASIERLTELGFPRNAALQAYLACDKNEEMAANFLFENGDD